VKHCSEEELILHYYGEAAGNRNVGPHLDQCDQCARAYQDLAATLQALDIPAVPERDQHYGLEVWQRIRHRLPEPGGVWPGIRMWGSRVALAGAAAALVTAGFAIGWWWPREASEPQLTTDDRGLTTDDRRLTTDDSTRQVLLAAVADHLDRSERVLMELQHVEEGRDISAEKRRAEDLLSTNRLYRQDAVDAGEHSLAAILDELERSLVDVVHSPSRMSAAGLEQMRRRIDAASLLFKVRVMSLELRAET
jgi:hypothetical protein